MRSPYKLAPICAIKAAKVTKVQNLAPPQERNLRLFRETCVLAVAQVFLYITTFARFSAHIALFSPSQLRKVLKEIQSRLNAGWDFTPALQAGNLWKSYQEAQVVTTATAHGPWLFIHFPVIEVTRNFEL